MTQPLECNFGARFFAGSSKAASMLAIRPLKIFAAALKNLRRATNSTRFPHDFCTAGKAISSSKTQISSGLEWRKRPA